MPRLSEVWLAPAGSKTVKPTVAGVKLGLDPALLTDQGAQAAESYAVE